jgi:hypothetical protein
MNNKERLSRNLNAHAEATAAMYIWGSEYVAQKGGCMDFWDGLREDRKELCRDLVAQIKLRPSEASLSPDDVSAVGANND